MAQEGKRERREIIQSFMDFVDRVLALQGNSPLKKFSLKCLTVADTVRLDGWISNALARGVSDLDLAIILDYDEEDDDDDSYYQLSSKCFECSTLVSLRIDYGTDIALVASARVSLPLLKTLVLDSVLVCPNEFETLLRALPALEELLLVEVMWKEMKGVTVSSASVKRLTIKLNDCLSSLSFDTPSLIHFDYSGFVASDHPVVNMENLFDARIVFCLSGDQLKLLRDPDSGWFEEEVVLSYTNLWKLFLGIPNVQNLDLFPDTLEMLSMCTGSLPVFNNLKSLYIKSNKDRGWQAMPALLSNCPHLETLVIEGLGHHVTDECGDACDCISREGKGLSLTVCPVKELEIKGFRGTMKEMGMIKHFLDYFPCLKEMEVYVEQNDHPTQLGNRQVSKLVQEMFQLYNKLYSCNVQLLLSDYLHQKWLKNKKIS